MKSKNHCPDLGEPRLFLCEDACKRYFRKSVNAYPAQKRVENVNFEFLMISDYAGQVEDAGLKASQNGELPPVLPNTSPVT